MSIAPPSDVVLDVAQAADPQKLRAATAKLVQLGSGAVGDDFGAQLAAAGRTKSAPAPTPGPVAGTTVTGRKSGVYEKFEAMMLQNFLGELLPKDSDLFGDAVSADAYRSMLADQLATQLARTGKLGIAQALAAAHKSQDGAAPAGAPAAPEIAAALSPAAIRPTA